MGVAHAPIVAHFFGQRQRFVAPDNRFVPFARKACRESQVGQGGDGAFQVIGPLRQLQALLVVAQGFSGFPLPPDDTAQRAVQKG